MIDINILNKLNAPTKEERLANLAEVLKTTVPPKFLDVNLKAFDMGWNHQ